jgi:hypothetical protein
MANHEYLIAGSIKSDVKITSTPYGNKASFLFVANQQNLLDKDGNMFSNQVATFVNYQCKTPSEYTDSDGFISNVSKGSPITIKGILNGYPRKNVQEGQSVYNYEVLAKEIRLIHDTVVPPINTVIGNGKVMGSRAYDDFGTLLLIKELKQKARNKDGSLSAKPPGERFYTIFVPQHRTDLDNKYVTFQGVLAKDFMPNCQSLPSTHGDRNISIYSTNLVT